jgi:integrase
VSLPKGVHHVVSRSRDYFYFQINRGTKHAGPRIVLPNNPHTPEFWIAVREAQGLERTGAETTFAAVCDLYETSKQFGALAPTSRDKYRRSLKPARAAWGDLPATGLRPVHIRTLLDEFGDRPGTGNNILCVLWALNKWGRSRGYFDQSITEGVEPYKSKGGHKPWTQAQQQAARAKLTGNLRRAYFLLRYTGQRGSDVVRLGETFIDDGGFRLVQQKNGAKVGEIWCPIEPELAAEIATWPRRPGPYLQQNHGKRYSRELLDHQFAQARADIPELVGCTLHGLRATRVVELRQRGGTTLQIQDQVGMSLRMIERYCRFADRKANGKAAVLALAERRKNGVL